MAKTTQISQLKEYLAQRGRILKEMFALLEKPAADSSGSTSGSGSTSMNMEAKKTPDTKALSV